jgi:tetratricopeptide (TPR) repeat protein
MSSTPSATVSVGLQPEYTRLAFSFAGATTVAPTMNGNRLELRFSRGADIDIAELRASPPRFVREVRRVSAAGQPVRLVLTLDPGVRERHFTDGSRVMVDLLPPEQGSQSADGAPTPAAPPVRGTATVQLIEDADTTRIVVHWPAPARAAAFRRGEAVWLMFDAAGQINLSGVARAGRRHQDMEIVRGEGVIGLRIPAPPDVQVSARAEDNDWVFTLGPRSDTGSGAVVRREANAEGRGRLLVSFGREGVVRWVNDPEIGDRIAIAMIGGPGKGVEVRRATLEAAILPAAHGAVVEPRADDVTVTFANGELAVTRGDGLIAAAEAVRSEARTNAAQLEAALIESHEGIGSTMLTGRQIRDRIDDLQRRAAAEGTLEGAPVTARMELARFLLQNELAPEALGALRIVAINQGELVELDPEFRLMRGAANVMLGRVQEALADLNASALADDPSAALWRGYALSLKQDWSEARRELERGAGALEQHPPSWRSRFQLALAQAALELNDSAAAEAAARAAMGQATTQSVRLHARLIEARLANALGRQPEALQMLDELSRTRDEEVAVRATLEAVRIRRATGVMRPVDSVELLEALRFRWRGDATELAIVGTLGETYSELGRWREALATMRVASDRFPMEPSARRLRADMSTLFERLFLDGEADQIEPIQALGLFYEFSDLTPVGPNGDRIVRLLAGRLVHVDLLEQAAQLLQHQVDERLEGIGKAQVASDLAAIYLMDGKSDRALVALASSRQPNMPATLLADRRILEARALLGLGRLDHAVELVERDRSEDAQRVRAEAAWRARDWERAAVELRTLLSLRNRAVPLDAGDRQAVLRTGIALTLSGNEEGVRAFYRDYAGDMAGTEEADSFEVVASGVHAEGAAIRDVARIVARTDLLDRFMQRIRARMTEHAANTPAAPAAPGQTPPNPAAPPPVAAATPPNTPQRQTPAAAAPSA